MCKYCFIKATFGNVLQIYQVKDESKKLSAFEFVTFCQKAVKIKYFCHF